MPNDDSRNRTYMDRILGPSVEWESCTHATLETLTEHLRRFEPSLLGGVRATLGRRARLPFYTNHDLFDLKLEGADEVDRCFVVQTGDLLTWLDGTSTPVHDMNEADSLDLKEGMVLDYLRWFLFCVRGDEGAFALLDAPDAISNAGAGDERLASTRAGWVPFAITGRQKDGRFDVGASIAYGEAIFTAQFGIYPTGSVEMVDDDPVVLLEGLNVPAYPPLAPVPTRLKEGRPSVTVRAHSATAPAPPSAPSAKPHNDSDVTKAVVSVLLDEAVRARLGHRLLQRFNTQTGITGPAAQLLRFVQGSTPIIVIESEIPFAEDIIASLLDPAGSAFPESGIERASAMQGDDTCCSVNVRMPLTALHLISFHAYRSLWDMERTAHELAIGSAVVLIGGERMADVPEPLRRVTDLVLTLPRIDASIFAAVFERVFHSPPPGGWDGGPGRGDWTRYLLHTDFHAPLRLGLTHAEALEYLRERCAERLRQVSAEDALSLAQLHGMGEARQIAEDLIADIAAAREGAIPWSAVDRGFLLVGAPGTGKTTLARAIARECNIKFVQASATQWQAAGALDAHIRAIRATFSEARRYAPAILFIDEIDSIGNRELLVGHNASYQTEVVNAVLEQIQGMDAEEPVIVIGATNFVDRVDPALRRAGRLDQVVTIPRPNVAALTEIFKHYLRPHRDDGTIDGPTDEELLGQLAFGATGADVEFFVRGAARRARKERRNLTQADLVAEVTRRPRREENVIRLSPDELKRVAVHEAGHALVSLLGSRAGAEISYVSVIPRMDGSLGFVASAPSDGASMTRQEAVEHLEITLGGRAAEELVYGDEGVSLGAGGDATSDLATATRIATALVCTSGLAADGSLLWTSQATGGQLVQIEALLRRAYDGAKEQLKRHRPALDKITHALVRTQELDGDELRALARDGGAR